MRKANLFVLIVVLSASVSCHQSLQSPHGRVLFSEDFDKYPDGSGLPRKWWREGGNAVRIENGYLRVDANPDGSGEDNEASTVWLNREFSGDLRVEFDAYVIASDGDKNNINFFFLFSDPAGKSLYDSKDERSDGKYGKYHELNGYVFTFLVNGNPDRARFRMRDDPGFHLLCEEFAYECKQGKTYRVAVTKNDKRITYEVNGRTWLDFVDDKANPEHKAGIIGFRTWRTDLLWDNLKVIGLEQRASSDKELTRDRELEG